MLSLQYQHSMLLSGPRLEEHDFMVPYAMGGPSLQLWTGASGGEKVSTHDFLRWRDWVVYWNAQHCMLGMLGPFSGSLCRALRQKWRGTLYFGLSCQPYRCLRTFKNTTVAVFGCIRQYAVEAVKCWSKCISLKIAIFRYI